MGNSKEKRHINIPIFIPHLGCPNVCVFCDQRSISGTVTFKEEDVRVQIEEVLKTTEGCEREIAFFGGSFTGIDRGLMVRLLDTAQEYVNSGEVSGIRMSTRPDYIDEEIIGIIGRYTLSEVELGVQSMVPRVLEKSKRGHTPESTERACALLRGAGIPFVGQMMIGLPGSEAEDEVYTAGKICEMGAAGARIYPTIVFKCTELENMMKTEYKPLSVDEAVSRSADVLEVFIRHGVTCRRIGLCDSEVYHSDEKYAAGPAHPAMGEMVIGEIYRRQIDKKLRGCDGKIVTVEVPRGRISAAVGQHGNNKKRIIREHGIRRLKIVENGSLGEYETNIIITEIQSEGENRVCI